MRRPKYLTAQPIDVVGIDGGFAKLGFVHAVFDRWGGALQVPRVIRAEVFQTEKEDKKLAVLSSDDITRRSRELVQALREVWPERLRVLCAESLSIPRSSSAALKIGIAWGTVCSLIARETAMCQASPQRVRAALGLSKQASKDEIEARVIELVPGFERCLRKIEPPYIREHASDALAAILCAQRTSDIMRAVLA